MQLGLSTGVAAELETGWNLETISRWRNCSIELRTAKPKISIANAPCPLFQKLQHGEINQLESTENTVITTRYHLTFAVRECFEQMHRGDRFIFEYPSNASSWNELLCTHKPIVRSSDSRVRSMATMKSAKAEKLTAVKTAEEVATVKSLVESVAVEATAKTIVAKQAERRALSKGIRPRGSVGAAWHARAEEVRRREEEKLKRENAEGQLREIEENSKADGEAAEMKRQELERAERGRAAQPVDEERLNTGMKAKEKVVLKTSSEACAFFHGDVRYCTPDTLLLCWRSKNSVVTL